MKGWRDMICEDLKQRFPYTKFTFVTAGIPSTGSTPGAFRLTDDVLSKGKVDLLFVEAAVNDDTNGFSAIEQVRGYGRHCPACLGLQSVNGYHDVTFHLRSFYSEVGQRADA